MIGAHLRARRALITPADVGLTTTGGRRTPGLRREEVAALAGISVDYYTRLEKGRDLNPSAQVLDALARALQLDATATRYLHTLTTAAPRTSEPRPPQTVPTGSRLLLEVIGLPAFVEDRAFDVLAANQLAGALSPLIRPGCNRLRSMFLDEQERRLHADWEREAVAMVAEFRASVGVEIDTPRVAELVGELAAASETFRRAWTQHDVDTMVGVSTRLTHPRIGTVTLRREEFPITGTDGQLLVVHFADPGSDDADKLTRLAPLPGGREPVSADPEQSPGASGERCDRSGSSMGS